MWARTNMVDPCGIAFRGALLRIRDTQQELLWLCLGPSESCGLYYRFSSCSRRGQAGADDALPLLISPANVRFAIFGLAPLGLLPSGGLGRPAGRPRKGPS